MANELRHKDVGTALSKSEWEDVSSHILNSQAAGDVIYASSTTQLTRLGIGAAKQILAVNSAGTAPEWTSSPPIVTALVPDAADGATIGTAALEFSDIYLADGGVIYLGNDQDVSITHVADTGILLNSTMQIQFNDASQYINAPSGTVLDINATDEIELNATLVDANANLDVSGTYTGGGLMTTGGNIVIPNAGNIGSASDTDAIAISSGGVVTMNQIPVFSAGINVSGGTIAGTLATAAQGSVTSLGTLTALTVDDVAIDGKVITMTGSASDTAVFTAGTNGTLSIVTTDAAAAAANIQITADGTVDIDSAGVLTLDSGAAINIEPASGSAVLIDGTLSIDAGVVTGATSITSTTFVGNIDAVDGDFDGTLEADAITVDGTALNEYIADTVGAMVGGNTETNIAVTYEDGDNTLDFVIGTLNQDTTGTAAIATTVTISDNESTDEDNVVVFGAGGVHYNASIGLESDGNLIYNPSTGRLSATQLAGTLQTVAQANITSVGTLTGLTVNGAAIFNENSADVDFRIESNGNANMFVVDGGNDRVGIGEASPDTVLHIKDSAPDITLEDSDGGDVYKVGNNGGNYRIRNVTDSRTDLNIDGGGAFTLKGPVTVGVDDTGHDVQFYGATSGKYMLWDESQDELIISGGVGIGESAPANLLHVKVSDTGITPHASAQIVLERDGTNYLQFLTGNDGTSGLLFGDEDDVDVSKIYYDHNTKSMIFSVETDNVITIDSDVGDRRITLGDAGDEQTTEGLLYLNPNTHTVGANRPFHYLYMSNNNVITIPSGTASLVTALNIEAPNITATGTVTNTATMRIAGAMTEGGTGNYALWVDAGLSRFDGAVGIGGVTNPEAYHANADDLVVWSSGNTGITIATNDQSSGRSTLYMSDGTASDAEKHAGYITYLHSDNSMYFGTSGNAQASFYLDASQNGVFVTDVQIGTGTAADRKIVFDGNAVDYYIGLDDGTDDLYIGTGSTVGSNGAIIIDDGKRTGIGTSPNANYLLTIGGAHTGGSNSFGVRVEPTITGVAGNNASILNVAGTLVEAGSGTHANLWGSAFSAPTVTGGSAAVTNTATVWISGAMSAGTSNYAFWVDAGTSRFDGVSLHYDGVQLGYDGTNTGEDFLAYGDTSGSYMFWDASDNRIEMGAAPIRFYRGGASSILHYHTDGTTHRWEAGFDSGASHSAGFYIWSGTTSDYLIHETGENLTLLPEGIGHVHIGLPHSNTFVNANMTAGLTINQETNDNEILAFKSSDVAHGMTSNTETDTFAYFMKASGDEGGLGIQGVTEVTTALALTGRGVTDNTTKGTSASPYVRIQASKKSGTSSGAVGSDANILGIFNHATCRFIFDAEGSAHADVEWTTYDTYDDLAVIEDMEGELLSREVEAQTSRRKMLEKTGIIGEGSWHMEDGKPRAMINMNKLSMLHHGALIQANDRIKELETRLLALEGGK